jgi:hypothetical protein
VLDNPPTPSGSEPPPPAEGEPPAEGSPEGQGTQGQPLTAEEVEAQWKHRVSQKDRAHDAAERALRDENDALRRQLDALSRQPRSQSSGQSNGGNDDPAVEVLRQQLDEQRRATEAERQARVIDSRKAKYPALARGVGEAGSSIFSTADEATLAKLNAQYDDGSSGTFAPTAPRRSTPPPAKPLGEMNKAELEQELRKSVERGDLKRG